MSGPRPNYGECRLAVVTTAFVIGSTLGCSGGDPASPSVEREVNSVATGDDANVVDAGVEVGMDAGPDIMEAAICPRDFPDACPSPAPSWMSTVRIIIETHCTPCHFPGGVDDSVRDLSTYQGVHKNFGSIFSSVGGCSMPPSDSGALTPTERDELFAWLVCGAPNN